MEPLWNGQAILAFGYAKPIFWLWRRHNSKGRSVRLPTINLRSLERANSQEFLCVTAGISALRQIALRRTDGYSLVYHYQRLIGGLLFLPTKNHFKTEWLIVTCRSKFHFRYMARELSMVMEWQYGSPRNAPRLDQCLGPLIISTGWVFLSIPIRILARESCFPMWWACWAMARFRTTRTMTERTTN